MADSLSSFGCSPVARISASCVSRQLSFVRKCGAGVVAQFQNRVRQESGQAKDAEGRSDRAQDYFFRSRPGDE
jgi:hypothetical protein